MPPSANSQTDPAEPFEPTHWSVVLAAGQEADAPAPAQTALAELCRTYWAPLYGFIRGRGYAPHDAQDLTQGFFCHLIERRLYARADQARGKFRVFLLMAVKHFLNDAGDRERALKRGGGCEFLPLQEDRTQAAEALFRSSAVPGVDSTGDRLFERQWADTLIGATLERLAAEYATEGKGPLYQTLQDFVRGSAEPLPSYDELAARLATPAVTVRSHVKRLRSRYRELLRAELRRTVATEPEVDEELRELLRVLTAR